MILNKSKSDEIDTSKYKVYLRTVKASAIRTLSEALKEVLLETNMHFTKDGVKICAIDSMNIAFVNLRLDALKFDSYYCPNRVSVGIRLTTFHKLLKTVGNNDIISLYIEKDSADDNQNLGIQIYNKEKKVKRISKLTLIDLDEKTFSVPKMEFDNTFTVQCVDFQKYCRDLWNISENIDIFIKNEGDTLVMIAKGTESDQMIEIGGTKYDDEGEGEKEDDSQMIGSYKVKFLNLFCKSSSMCNTLQVSLKETYPIVLTYSVADIGEILFCLTPNAIVG